jgi:hypothetical protein
MGGGSGGLGGSLIVGGAALGISFLSSYITSSVALRSFGGRIALIVPCVSGLGPSIWVKIIPAGSFPTSYIWTPLTITRLAGPPTHPGQEILGLADIPYFCWIGDDFYYGRRMTMIGTSGI